jgi:uncharacterized membrane protein YfcA
MESILITVTALFLSSLVMGLTGYGFVMVGVSIMSLCFPLKTVIPFIFPYNVVINIILIWRLKSYVSVSRVLPQLTFFAPGAIVGSLLLIHWADDTLKIMVGITLTVFCLWSLMQPEVPIVCASNLWSGFTGFAGGVLGGALYMPGPPVIMYNAAIAPDRFQFKVDLQLYFLFANGLLLGIYAYLGLFSLQSLKLTLYYSPCIAVGMVVGMQIFSMISNRIFKTMSVLLLGCLGASILIRELL